MRMSRRVLFAVSFVMSVFGQVDPARAVENRLNIHLELGPNLTLDQPGFQGTEKQALVATGGLHLRFTFEYALSEWLGLEAGWSPDLLVAQFESRITGRQSVVLGARFRPWWSRSNQYLLQRNNSAKLGISDLLSDVWVDAHAGISGGNGTRFGFDVGAGTRLPLISPVQIGVFVRYAQLFAIDGTFDDPTYKQISLGVTVSLGFLPVHREADSDSDGVPDSRDRCPETPAGATVNDVGCPMRKSSEPPPRCSDTDLDGVCDGEDNCPDTPLGTKVDTHGCPVDGSGAPPPSE